MPHSTDFPIPETSPTKCCTRCKQVKTFDLFGFSEGRLRSQCKACRTEIERLKRLANPEKVRERDRLNYWANVEHERELLRVRRARSPESFKRREDEYRLKNADKIREQKRLSYWRNPEKARQRERNRRINNPDIMRQKDRDRYLADPQTRVAYNRLRKARLAGAEGRYSKRDIDELFIKQAGCCAYCRRSLSLIGIHIDHIIPVVKGGSNWPHNLALACPKCNLTKHDKTPDEWVYRWYVCEGGLK